MVNCSNSPKLVYVTGRKTILFRFPPLNKHPTCPLMSFSQVQKPRKQMVLECCLWMFVAILLLGRVISGQKPCLQDVIVVLYIYIQIIPTFGVCNHSYTHLGFDRILFKWALLAKLILVVDQFRHSRAKHLSNLLSKHLILAHSRAFRAMLCW